MKKVLVIYCTNSGSTAEIAAKLANELTVLGHQAACQAMDQVNQLESYDAVLIGAPMIIGWHAAAKKFIRKNQAILCQKQVAYFCTMVSLTQDAAAQAAGMPLYVDPRLAKAPLNPNHLSFRECYALAENYLRPIQKSAPKIKPMQVALFGGKLDMAKLNVFQMIFVLGIIRAQPGDFRNWAAIRQWASEVNGLIS
jgi:menaquinone-dependent protoporphyrinogen IX oxidase